MQYSFSTRPGRHRTASGSGRGGRINCGQDVPNFAFVTANIREHSRRCTEGGDLTIMAEKAPHRVTLGTVSLSWA
jgi:hypothetical protein